MRRLKSPICVAFEFVNFLRCLKTIFSLCRLADAHLNQFCSVHAVQNCVAFAEYSNLLDAAYNRMNFEAAQFRVDGVQTADEMLEEKFVNLQL